LREGAAAGWLATLIDWEEQERTRRSLERRLRAARIGRFKPACESDWTWPKRCDRPAFEALMRSTPLNGATNAILVGPNGVGKSTLERNIAHQPLTHRHTMLFISAVNCSATSPLPTAIPPLRRRLRHYAGPPCGGSQSPASCRWAPRPTSASETRIIDAWSWLGQCLLHRRHGRGVDRSGNPHPAADRKLERDRAGLLCPEGGRW